LARSVKCYLYTQTLLLSSHYDTLIAVNETKTTPRQNFIVNLVNEGKGIGRAGIEQKLQPVYPASKPTIARELARLVTNGVIKIQGIGRSTIYLPATDNPLLTRFDLEQYFSLEPDQRVGAKKKFDFSVFSRLTGLLTHEEIENIESQNRSFSRETSQLDRTIYTKELERFVIELSWKSSKIEGNTYSLLETETLIKDKVEATGKTKAEAVMILNHKRAFENILEGRGDFKNINLSKINELHRVLTDGLSISPGVREQAVGITGTVYKPLDNKWQIIEALEKMSEAINSVQYPLEQALIANAMISYIQPFADGNKRTGRMLTNTILLVHDFFPLSYRSVDEDTYKKALILFYEQGSIYSLKEIFINQYKFALDTYFRSS
jgi:fido (protein-threonine AMPylation protein)